MTSEYLHRAGVGDEGGRGAANEAGAGDDLVAGADVERHFSIRAVEQDARTGSAEADQGGDLAAVRVAEAGAGSQREQWGHQVGPPFQRVLPAANDSIMGTRPRSVKPPTCQLHPGQNARPLEAFCPAAAECPGAHAFCGTPAPAVVI